MMGWFDSSDKKSDLILLLTSIGFLAIIIFEAYHVLWRAEAFDVLQFGQAMAYYLSGSGLAAAGAGLQRNLQGDKS